MIRRWSLLALFMAASVLAFADDHMNCPMMQSASDQHHQGVDSRGDQAMGFDHTKTTHHFLLRENGGAIQITANDPADTASRDAIRAHLPHIAEMFSQGRFEMPMFIHDRVPPGVPVMKEKKDRIRYSYEEIPDGGRVVISTEDPAALDAIHAFLKFQIEDHRTGDPLK